MSSVTTVPTNIASSPKMSSPRSISRDIAQKTICRNIFIHGHCRYEKTCGFLHDSSKLLAEQTKARFNVESPNFVPRMGTPTGFFPNGIGETTISPKPANAAIFTPQSTKTTPNTNTSPQMVPERVEWARQHVVLPDYGYKTTNMVPAAGLFDPFSSLSVGGLECAPSNVIPFSDSSQNAGSSWMQPQFHLYAPVGPHHPNLPSYHRDAHDFFIPEELRDELKRKSDAILQTMPGSNLPSKVAYFQNLVTLDTSMNTTGTVSGYQTWLYKATSIQDGKVYALRRIENYRLENEAAVRTAQTWKRVDNGGAVTLHDAFTTKVFGDVSLILVYDYHPLSKTLAEVHFHNPIKYQNGRTTASHIPEQTLWGYLVQLVSALKSIHAAGLSVRLIDASKVILSGKNRVRYSACGMLDVIWYGDNSTVVSNQQEDMLNLGRLMLCLAANNLGAAKTEKASLQRLGRNYSIKFKEVLRWLLTCGSGSMGLEAENVLVDTPEKMAATIVSTGSAAIAGPEKGQASSEKMSEVLEVSGETVGNFKCVDETGKPLKTSKMATCMKKLPEMRRVETCLAMMAPQITSVLDSAMHEIDELCSTLGRELENGRLVRLQAKLACVTERPEYSNDPVWAETSDRYYIKLLLDYIFHQVDEHGNPKVDLGHIIRQLNLLDTGSDERIVLTSRDDQHVLVVTYRDMKNNIETAFNGLAGNGGIKPSAKLL